jgi:hypothetical protein
MGGYDFCQDTFLGIRLAEVSYRKKGLRLRFERGTSTYSELHIIVGSTTLH